MKIPNKIGIIDTAQSTDSRLRFDKWEGYDSKMQMKHLAIKINEILDFLYAHPDLANEFGDKLKAEGEKMVHEHEWQLNLRLGSQAFYECRTCGETQQRYIPSNLA